MPNDYTLLGVLSSADRKNLHTLIERIKAAALTPKKPVNTTPRISRAGSLSRGKAPGTRPVLNVPKPVRQPEAQPRPSDLRPKPKPVGRKSLNLDAYGLPVRNTSDFSPVTCRLSKDLAEKIRVCIRKRPLSSGKTYTMLDELSGLYVLTARDMFSLLDKPEYGHLGLWISFFEIYQGNIIDLLNKERDFSHGMMVPLRSVENLIEVFEYGNGARSTGTTEANADSSRSHAIMQLSLKRKGKKNETYGNLGSFLCLTKQEGLVLLTWLGVNAAQTEGKQMHKQGAEINKSLLALKECIRALDQDKTHLPFRQSKLTQVLKESFVEIEEELQPTEELPEPVPIADEDYPSIEPSAPAVINIPTRLSFPSEERTYTVPRASLPRYSMHTIESVARNHRAQIRLVAELCKTETQLLTDLTNRMAMSGTDLQTTKEVFENYMFELDELLERKLVCIEELKEQLAQVLSRTNRYH
ncbi:hypothetical protein L0F63_003214 [Massospora cicadina]|nr:hypothetical protein L0F63_003214 [Massospora cicadina]